MIQIYNTQTRRKEELKTLEPNKVRMYVCGPTTYNFIHLGNARPLVVFDTVRRYLVYRRYDVTYVQNFTDVDDKIINRAKEEGIPAHVLAQRYIDEFKKDAQALGVLEPDVSPRVSDHIPDIINVIAGLVAKGHAYVRDGDVYFRVSSFPGYGKLSGRSRDEMMAGARVDVDERKESPFDFALWKAAKPGEPSWASPWGKGRPGWHIECSVMSMKYLGTSIDIHGGGADLVFPHHENEIAQSEAFSGRPFVRYWMHNGFITVNQEKMSKSLGNFFIVRDILTRFSPQVVRYYLLATHYRSPLDFDDSKLEEAARALERLKNCSLLLQEALNQEHYGPENQELLARLEELKARFIAAMDDDFNTALALSHMFEMVHEINSYINNSAAKNQRTLSRANEAFNELIQVMGLDLRPHTGYLGAIEELTRSLIEFRTAARREKDYQTADALRDVFNRNGIVIEDSKDGTRIKFEQETALEALVKDLNHLVAELRRTANKGARADMLEKLLKDAGTV